MSATPSKKPDKPSKRQVGSRGEEHACRYLRRRGYRILHRNLRLGRAGELDIVARHRNTLAFVEVKSVIAGTDLSGFEHITHAKQLKLIELAQLYLQKYKSDQQAIRFDAVEVVFVDDSLKRFRITHLPDAFRPS